MNISKKFVGIALGLSLVIPAVSQAASLTSSQVSAVINLLQSFNVDASTIATVQSVLTGTGNVSTPVAMPPVWAQGSSTPGMMPPGQVAKAACITLNRNLGQGSQGEDVRSLQQMLAEDPQSGFDGEATGYFGPKTMRAMMQFQVNNNIASSATGAVGPMTRGFFERRCGEGLGNGGTDQGQGQDRGGQMMGIRGEIGGLISAVNGSSITVQSQDSKSVMVNVTASTTIMVMSTSTSPTTGSMSDLVVGQAVRAQGPRNADGSINALQIQVGAPQTMMGR